MTNPNTQPGAAPATGNTEKEQEMYAAGIRTGEENAKHNAAIRGQAITQAPQLQALADKVVISNATGNESLFLAAVKELLAAVREFRPAAPASPVSTVEQGDVQNERSATHGMTLGERIAHVGGRTNAQGYIEFGSPMAVNALIQYVLRDIDWTRQDDDGGYQARYRLPGGEWSSWGHVVCGVKGHEQELRYLPGERRPAPAAGDALDAAPWSDCKVAYSIDDDDALWTAWESGKLQLPKGWALNETDCSGARVVAIFRVDGMPTIADGLAVRAAIAAQRQGDA